MRTVDVGLEGAAFRAPRAAAQGRAARRGPAAGLRRADTRPAPGGRLVGGLVRQPRLGARAACCSPATLDGNVAAVRRVDADRRRRPRPLRGARARRSGLHLRRVARERGPARRWAASAAPAAELRAARFDRALDAGWRRTSYSDITAAAHEARVVERAGGGRQLADEPEARACGPSRRRRRAPALRGDRRSLARRRCRRASTSARSSTACSRRRTSPPPTSTPSSRARRRRSERGGRSTSAIRRWSRPGCARRSRRRSPQAARGCATSRAPTASTSSRSSCRSPAATSRLAASRRPRSAALLRAHLRRATRCAATPSGSTTPSCATACAATSPAASTSSCGADTSFLVVDYKTNWLAPPGEELTAWHHRPDGARRRDGARPLRAPGAALPRRAAPLPALAAAGLRPRAQPRRRGLPVPARDDRSAGQRRLRVPPPGALVAAISDLLDARRA